MLLVKSPHPSLLPCEKEQDENWASLCDLAVYGELVGQAVRGELVGYTVRNQRAQVMSLSNHEWLNVTAASKPTHRIGTLIITIFRSTYDISYIFSASDVDNSEKRVRQINNSS